MKKRIFLLLAVIALCVHAGFAQRKYQDLSRGVVACNNGSSVFISWRYLAQEPESVQYNLYCNPAGTGSYTLLNTSGPLTNTNFTTTVASVPNNSLLSVAPVIKGVEGTRSNPYKFVVHSYRSIYLDLTYSTFLPWSDYVTKFIWPADLDGDGDYDFVVDRLSITGSSHKIEGYLRSGEKLWTVDMGPNVKISQGHDDMVLAYDMDCDGKAEVVIKSSDGTRFWDKQNETWGKYLFNSGNPDTDNDGIVDYTAQSVKNEPQFITVINGLTGAEMNTIAMPFPATSYNTYTRTNKADYWSGENSLTGHMGIVYLDGVHPSAVMEYKVRKSSGTHCYYVTAWGYKFVKGKATDWEQKYTFNRDNNWAAEFHHIRTGDVDLDGKDEMLEGGYTLDDNGKMLFSAYINHGDRFRVGDINPDRPGLETFAIQQNSPDMLGQILYDARTGTAIKKWYMGGVGDVGRGECIDIDKRYKGYEMWSTMGNIYNCKGDMIYQGGVDMPKEGMWWDGELDREILDAKDGDGANAMITKYAGNGSYQSNRLIQFASMMNWAVMAEYGCRPMFFGDIDGDWREEVLLRKKYYVSDTQTGCSGFIAFTTDYPTSMRLYCLMQNGMYRGQTTTKGYYQSPYPDYYLGYDMSQPPLPPFMKTDLVWKSGVSWNTTDAAFTGYDESTDLAFEDGKSVMFDLSGSNADTIRLSGTLKPSVVYAQVPLNRNYTFGGNGRLSGEMDLWKSQNGTLIINGSHDYTGRTIVSEGTLELNGNLVSVPDVRAKGTLAGNATLLNGLTFQQGLNYEGGRLAPGTTTRPYGKITINGNVSLPGNNYFEMNLRTQGATVKDTVFQLDTIQINGNLAMAGVNYLNIRSAEEKPLAGEYPLVHWTGTLTGDSTNMLIMGLKGMSTTLKIKDNTLILVVKGQRDPQAGIVWDGSNSAVWNFNDENFKMGEDRTPFVNGDQLVFNDESSTKTITVNEFMSPASITVDNSLGDYTFKGDAGISGTTGITKNGASALILSTAKSDYTGATVINGGVLEVSALADGGLASAIGAANTGAANLVINNATLRVNNINTATNRAMTLTGNATIEVPNSGGVTILKGNITGAGKLIKSGSGQLSITNNGPTTYTGGTIIKAGTLAQGTYNTTFGTPGSALGFEGNGTVNVFNNNSTSQVPVFNYAVNVPAGVQARINGGQRCNIAGSLTGEGTFTFMPRYVRCDVTANWSAFAGTINVVPDGTGSQFRLCNANGMASATVNLNDNVTMGYWTQGSGTEQNLVSSVGMLTGSALAYVNNGTFNVGGNNKSGTFQGIVNTNATINKYGTGTWTLTNANLNTSAVQVFGGTLTAANSTGSATGTGTVQVKNNATLNGTGRIGGSVVVEAGGTLSGSLTIAGAVTVRTGATIQPGTAPVTSARTLTINNNLTTLTGSTIKLNVLGGFVPSGDKIIVNGTYSPSGTLFVVNPSNSVVYEGSKYTLIQAAVLSAGRFDSVSLPALPENMYWDTTALYTNGSIVAKLNTAVHPVESGSLFEVDRTTVTTNCNLLIGNVKGKARVELLDAKGQLLDQFSVESSGKRVLNVSDRAPGLYFLRLVADSGTILRQIVKKSN